LFQPNLTGSILLGSTLFSGDLSLAVALETLLVFFFAFRRFTAILT
jgi:hypothetical protein